MKSAPLYIAALILSASVSHAGTRDFESPVTPTRFARIATDWNGQPRALQMAIVTYTSSVAAERFSVDLISAIHVGDRTYYDELNEHFRDYDALLYELILPEAPGEAAAAGKPTAETEASAPDLGFISTSQVTLKNALGLAFQLDEIDYSPHNFVHADLSSSMLMQRMQDRQESLYVYFWRLFFASLDEYARDPLGINDLRLLASLLAGNDDAVKIAFAEQLVDAAHRPDILGGENGSAVIAARNEHALQVLRERIANGDQRIGIFYGVAHMTDFEQRLLEHFDLRLSSASWLDAWRFGSSIASDLP